MQRRWLWFLTCFCVAVALSGLPSRALAQNEPPPGSVSTDQSAVLDAVIYPGPPPGFNPLAASDAELEVYGFPPRPDPSEGPAYRQWLRLVASPQTRITDAKLLQTNIYNGPARITSTGLVTGNATAVTTSNWSGYAVTAASGTFAKSGSTVVGEFVVPLVQQAFGICDGTVWYSSQWVGFDGFNSNDVLQAGTDADAYCAAGSPPKLLTAYDAWYEWAPEPEIIITSFAVHPGDLVGIEVWYTTASPPGHAYLLDHNTAQSVSIGFNPPSGTVFSGNSAEWIEERPSVNDIIQNLANYTSDASAADLATTPGKLGHLIYYRPGGKNPSGTTTYQITMTCPPWSPSTNCPSTQDISTPFLYGTGTIYFGNSPPSW